MRIIFIGTSEFAIPSLKKLHISHHNIELIITKPDMPKGRGRKLMESPVKKEGVRFGYNIKQPKSINSKQFSKLIIKYNPDLLVLMSFGEILKKNILKIPKYGSINVHPSLIPKYRGPAPIQWTIINGEKETGVTTILMNEKIDEGDILLYKRIKIDKNETYSTLHKKLSKIGSSLLIDTIKNISLKLVTPINQNHKKATLAPIFKKKDGLINWSNSAKIINCFVRGMNPWPGAYTFYKNKKIKILETSVINTDYNQIPGTVLILNKSLHVATGEKSISVETIQNESGKKMPIDAYLCGHKFSPNSTLGT